METKYNLCIFILSHGRPDKVITIKTLLRKKSKYPVYVVVDNEDKRLDEYYTNFGRDKVKVFDKLMISKTFDTGDNFENRKCIVYARNYCFELAKELGYQYFLQLDDDYTDFLYKFNTVGKFGDFTSKTIDNVIDIYMKFLVSTTFKSVAFSQNGDFIGGGKGGMAKMTIKRKAMNSFFCSIERPFKFVGRINEDVNTYCIEGSRGLLFGTSPLFALKQKQTQKQSGGMTELYTDSGTFLKSFYSVIYCPSFVKITLMGAVNQRLHHRISWNNAVPKILSEELKKK